MKPSEATDDDETAVRRNGTARSARPAIAELAGEFEPFDLPLLIEETTRPLAAEAVEKGLRMHVTTAPGLPREVAGHAAGLRAVLFALADNAVRFTEEGGEVVVAASADDRGGGRAIVHLEISDTGPGIPPAALRELDRGGLARSRALVDRLDGRLDCGTAAGHGSTLSVAVPLDLR